MAKKDKKNKKANKDNKDNKLSAKEVMRRIVSGFGEDKNICVKVFSYSDDMNIIKRKKDKQDKTIVERAEALYDEITNSQE